MISSFSKAISQISDPAFRRVVLLGIAGSLAIFAAAWFILGWVLDNLDLPVLNLWVWEYDLDRIKDVFGGIAVLAMTWLLFPAVVTLIVSFFLEDIAGAVDRRHYPALGAPRRQGIAEILRITVKFALIAVALNILALPVLLALFFSPFYPLVFYALNGYLLGREYFELVAHRRMDPALGKELRRARSGSVFIAGVIVAFLLTVPVVNLIAPVIGAAAMVHLVERWRRA